MLNYMMDCCSLDGLNKLLRFIKYSSKINIIIQKLFLAALRYISIIVFGIFKLQRDRTLFELMIISYYVDFYIPSLMISLEV